MAYACISPGTAFAFSIAVYRAIAAQFVANDGTMEIQAEEVRQMINLRDDYITAKEVAYNFGYSNIKSFYNAVNAGRFPLSPVVFGKRWYFNRTDIEGLLGRLGVGH